MSGVKDIKLIADTAVFSIISICLTMYCDVEAHDQTSGLGLKTSKLIFIWNRQSSQPQNYSPNGFSVFEFRIKIQLFNYHIYGVALAYFTGDALQTIFLCRWGLKKKITIQNYNDYWGHKARVMKTDFLSVKSFLPLVYFVYRRGIEHIESDSKVRIKVTYRICIFSHIR